MYRIIRAEIISVSGNSRVCPELSNQCRGALDENVRKFIRVDIHAKPEGEHIFETICYIAGKMEYRLEALPLGTLRRLFMTDAPLNVVAEYEPFPIPTEAQKDEVPVIPKNYESFE